MSKQHNTTLLINGPSGTGKIMIIHAIAHKLKLYILLVNHREKLNEYDDSQVYCNKSISVVVL